MASRLMWIGGSESWDGESLIPSVSVLTSQIASLMSFPELCSLAPKRKFKKYSKQK